MKGAKDMRNTMSKKEFTEILMKLLENQGIKTELCVMNKEHGSYTGLHKVTESVTAIANVDNLYEEFIHSNAGVIEMAYIAAETIGILNTYDSDSDTDVLGWLADWDVVKTRLFLSLCSKNATDYLEKVVYEDIPGTDLVLLPRIFIFDNGESFATTPLSHESLKSYGITEKECMEQAKASSEKLQPAKIGVGANSIGIVMIATSDFGSFGAATFFYDKVRHMASNMLGEKFYLLPTSSREILGLPEQTVLRSGCLSDEGVLDVDELCEKLQLKLPVERSHEDFLSDKSYFYDGTRFNIVHTVSTKW